MVSPHVRVCPNQCISYTVHLSLLYCSSYFFLLAFVMCIDKPGLFCVFGPAEIPTWFLSLGMINKKYRSDMLFGVTFFLTRILNHCYLAYRSKIWKSGDVLFKTEEGGRGETDFTCMWLLTTVLKLLFSVA